MSWLVLFVCPLSYPTIPLHPVKKVPKTVVTQQRVEVDGRSLRVLGAEAQPEKVGGGKVGSRMHLVKTGVVT